MEFALAILPCRFQVPACSCEITLRTIGTWLKTFLLENWKMKSTIGLLVLLGLASVSLPGCNEKVSVKEEKTVSSPEGTTTTTTNKEIKQSGSNPPPP
jgi:hypothetical protein